MNKLEQGVQNEQAGPRGPAGPAAGFGTPTATVDANTGTPEVTVTASGPDTVKVFAFAFKNLKGAKGDTGAAGAQGPAGATGPAGKGVKSIALTTTSGAVTGGTVTFDDDSTASITVTESGA